MGKRISIARIVKPQGIKGEVKLVSLGNDPSELLEADEVYLSQTDEKPVKVNKVWQYKDSIFMALDGVTSRNEAEELRGKTLYANIYDMEPLEEGVYYIADLIGCSLIDSEGKALGKITEILQHGAADIYVVKGERNFMMPVLKRVIKNTDILKKEITVDSQALSEVIVYED